MSSTTFPEAHGTDFTKLQGIAVEGDRVDGDARCLQRFLDPPLNRRIDLDRRLAGRNLDSGSFTKKIRQGEKRLREKIEDDPQEPKLILTVRGLGYKSG